MRRAADRRIDFAHGRRQPDAAARTGVEPRLHLVQSFFRIDAAPDNVELHGGAALRGIDIVAFPCGGQDAAAVEDPFFQPELSRNRIRLVTVPEFHARRGVLRVGVSALDHEIGNHAMEKQGIKSTLLDQFAEVVAVQRRRVIEPEFDGSQRRFEHHDVLAGWAGRRFRSRI